jgi:hypothetical protein
MTTEHSQTRAQALFKADHPREIDRHIAFFGDASAAGRDMCGEALLDALTHDSSDADGATSCA